MRLSHSFVIVAVLLIAFQGKATEDLPVVQNIDVTKYMGHWYLYAGISTIVDFFCSCTQTTYTADPTNSSLVNFDEYCKALSWAPYVHSHSYAEIDPVERAKWTNVNPIIGSLAARADYYIIDVEPNYQWSLVGSRDRSNLYVLSREKTMTDDVYNALLQKATSLGFDVSKVKKDDQSCDDQSF